MNKKVQYLDFHKVLQNQPRKYPQVFTKQLSSECIPQPKQHLNSMQDIQIEGVVEQKQQDLPEILAQKLQSQKPIPHVSEQAQIMEVQKQQIQLLTLLQNSTTSQKQTKMSYFQQELANLNKPESNISQIYSNKQQFEPTSLQNIYYEQISAIFFNCKISLSMKTLNQFPQSQVLIIPFVSGQLDLYPGSTLREQLTSQCQKLKKSLQKDAIIDGGIYIKNKKTIHHYNYLAFLKVQLDSFSKCLTKGLNLMLNKFKQDKKQVNNFVICLENNIDTTSILQGITESSEVKKSKKLYINISCQHQKMFKQQFKKFLDITT